MRWINIFRIHVTLLKQAEVIELCKKWLKEPGQHHIVTANPETLLLVRKDQWLNDIVRGASIITADGFGVCWAATFFETSASVDSIYAVLKIFLKTLFNLLFRKETNGRSIPERVSGSDLLWKLVEIAKNENKKIYLMGGTNGTARRAAEKINLFYPEINIAAFEPDHEATPYATYELNNEIEDYSPDIVFVAYGTPKQEEWINQNLSRFKSIKIAMGVGGALDFIAGNTSRAPLRLQNHGLEWFWRFTQRPTRIFRVLRAIVEFPIFILLSRLKRLYG